MLVISPTMLSMLMQTIVEATHGMTDTEGERARVSTIDAGALRIAALVGLQVATGETVLVAGEKIMVRRQQSSGVLDVEVR
jgi:hypothetical protein